MLKKFFKFLKEYVIISVYGKNAEKFINICMHRNISVWSIEPFENGIRLAMFSKDFFGIRSIARKCRVRVRIKQKCGLKYEFKRCKKRYMFFIGLALCIVFFIISSQFIWIVEINGVENSDINSIIKVLDGIGIKSGGLKSKIPEGEVIKREILNNTDDVAWAWVYIEGAKARVEIYEKILPPDVIDKNEPCDIVAACDGVIKRLVVRNGEEKVKFGDAVSAGDVIVSAKTAVFKEGYPEEYIYVHSMASVEAYTAHTQSGDYKLYYEKRIPTGKLKHRYSIELFGKNLALPMGDVDFADFDLQENRHELNLPFFGFTGIAFDSIEYKEVTVERQPLEMDTVLEIARNDLEAKISKELMPGSVLTDENIEYEKIDDETINVTLRMKFIENIAIEMPPEAEENKGEEIFDKQTDRSAAGD